jgi:hypothetical protein
MVFAAALPSTIPKGDAAGQSIASSFMKTTGSFKNKNQDQWIFDSQFFQKTRICGSLILKCSKKLKPEVL